MAKSVYNSVLGMATNVVVVGMPSLMLATNYFGWNIQFADVAADIVTWWCLIIGAIWLYCSAAMQMVINKSNETFPNLVISKNNPAVMSIARIVSIALIFWLYPILTYYYLGNIGLMKLYMMYSSIHAVMLCYAQNVADQHAAMIDAKLLVDDKE